MKKDEMVKNDARSERGASMVEYALLVSLIAVVAIAAVGTLGTTITGKFSSASSAIQGED
jgi:pilus assembly protein Flp/PilA